MSSGVIKQNKMGYAKMFPLIISMALPAMFSMMVQALYNIVDSYYVGQYSSEALSAVSLAFPMQNLTIAFSVGTAIGAGSLISRKLGEGDHAYASKVANTGLLLAIITWVFFLGIGLTMSEAFYRLYESNETIIAMGKSYLTIVISLSLFSFVQIFFEKTIQATGNMIWPMLMQLTGAIINIILDPILIFGYGIFPEMGVAGAAVATVFGQFCACAIAIFLVTKKNNGSVIAYSFKEMKLDKEIVKSIYVVGAPSIAMNSIGTVTLMLMNGLLSSFSTAAYTVYGIFFKLQSFILMPVFGLTSGTMPILGYNFGAKNNERFLSCFKIALCISLSMTAIGALAFGLIPEQLLMIFNSSPEMVEVGIPALTVMGIGLLFAGVSIPMSTLFQSIGKGVYSMIDTLLRQLVILIPMAYLLSGIEFGLVWYAVPIANFVSMTFATYLFTRIKKNIISKLGEPTSEAV